MALHDLRFRVRYLPKIANLLNLPNCITKRKRYFYDRIKSCCIVLKRLNPPCIWMDVEKKFGMGIPQLTEIFWDTIEHFTDNNAHHVTTLKTELFNDLAALYAEILHILKSLR